jgi:MFS family permease
VSFPDYLGEPVEVPGRAEPARPVFIRQWRHAEWLAVAAVCFGAITSSLDSGVITVSYPRLVHSLGRPLSEVAWIGLAPLITVVSTLIFFGKRADTLGRKRVYLDGFVVFLIGAVACSLSPSFGILIAARVVEALGVAMIQANSVALVASSVRDHQRATALGFQASAQAIGLATGPFLGGLFSGGRSVADAVLGIGAFCGVGFHVFDSVPAEKSRGR